MTQDMNNKSQTSNAGNTSAQGGANNENVGQNLVDELNRLGSKFAEVVQVAWESDERKRLEQDVKRGLSSLATNLEEGLKKVGESPQTKEFLNKAEDAVTNVADQVQKSKIAQELGDNLLHGLRSLTEQIDKIASDLQTKNKSTTATPSATPSASTQADQAQDIPIDRV